MDFFKAQEQARKKTRWLVFWFVLAVMGVIAVFYVLPVLLRLPLDGLMIFGQTFILLPFGLLVYKMYEQWKISKLGFVIVCIPGLLATILFALLFYALNFPVVDAKGIPRASLLDGERFLWTILIVGGFIALTSLHKIREISRRGGRMIAEQLGGRVIARATNDPAERRLLNVIDEMSIAAGIPAPVAFVLAEEIGLNAFAAGLTIEDSVIGVTQSLLATMNRDELQGVVAHEVGHIVNGDSRLNLKLIGILHGIYAITLLGRNFMKPIMSQQQKKISREGWIFIMRKNPELKDKVMEILKALDAKERRERQERAKPSPIILHGFILLVIGSVGLFFGRLIQATISREREYLADASAVQFTRNPDGLISALTKLHILGSEIKHPQAIAASHLFFGASDTSAMASLFATHPPLSERIVRLGGKWALPDLTALPKGEKETFKHPAISALMDNGLSEEIAAAAAESARLPEEISPESLTQAQNLLASLPETLREQTRTFIGATGILAGLLLARQPDIRSRQEKLIPFYSLPTARELYQWLATQPEHGAHYRLVWLDLILPTLREALESERQELRAMPAIREALINERQQLLVLAKDLISADGRVSPTEFALYSLLRGALLSPSERQVKRSELRLEQLDKDVSDLLALLAYSGHADADEAEAAYQAAIACSPASTKHPLPAKNELSLNKISEALSHLALAVPMYRKKLLDACAVAVQHDGKITPVENELLRAFAQSLDCPAPPATRLTFA